MINTRLMNFPSRLIFCVLLVTTLTSCQTWNGFKSSSPVRLLDELGAEFMGLFADNGMVKTRPEQLHERARQVERRGIYAGQSTAARVESQSMAAR